MATRLLKPLAAAYALGTTFRYSFAASALLVNATVDDIFTPDSTTPFFTYAPDGVWDVDCTNCTEVSINANLAFDGTWHSTLISGDNVKASVTFQGAKQPLQTFTM